MPGAQQSCCPSPSGDWGSFPAYLTSHIPGVMSQLGLEARIGTEKVQTKSKLALLAGGT